MTGGPGTPGAKKLVSSGTSPDAVGLGGREQRAELVGELADDPTLRRDGAQRARRDAAVLDGGRR